jgi:hypothetical protein
LVVRDPWNWGLGEGITQGLVAFQDSVVWFQVTGEAWPQYVRTALVMFSLTLSLALLAAIAYTFRPLGQWLAAWMDACPRPIGAYTANRTSHYVLPHELVGAREKVLVVGAGAGNDVAAALRAGARSVQAVEIDPAIVALGRARHPTGPTPRTR